MAKKESFWSHLESGEVDRRRAILKSVPTLEAVDCLGALAMKTKDKDSALGYFMEAWRATGEFEFADPRLTPARLKLAVLATDEDADEEKFVRVWTEVASNPMTPITLLRHLALTENSPAIDHVVTNIMAPAKLIEDAVMSDTTVAEFGITNPACPDQLLTRIYMGSSLLSDHLAIASNYGTHPDLLVSYVNGDFGTWLQDPPTAKESTELMLAVATNPIAPPEALQLLASKGTKAIKKALLENPGYSEQG